MDDIESAQERQGGPIKPRSYVATAMPYDSVWAKYMAEYLRMKEKGLSRVEALEVFRGLLEDPERKEAAEMMLNSAGAKQFNSEALTDRQLPKDE